MDGRGGKKGLSVRCRAVVNLSGIFMCILISLSIDREPNVYGFIRKVGWLWGYRAISGAV